MRSNENDKPPDVVFSLEQLTRNLAAATPALQQLIFAAMYLTGILFAFLGIHKLKHYGDMRTMMTSSAELKGPLLYLLTAACFLFFPSTFSTLLQTFFNSSTLLSYQVVPEFGSNFNMMLKSLGLIVQLVGVIAFFRGWLLIIRLANHGAQPGTFGKAVTHIVGGIFAINIFFTWEILEKTFGFNF